MAVQLFLFCFVLFVVVDCCCCCCGLLVVVSCCLLLLVVVVLLLFLLLCWCFVLVVVVLVFVNSRTTQQMNRRKQQRPLFHIVVCPLSLARFCPERGQQPKTKKMLHSFCISFFRFCLLFCLCISFVSFFLSHFLPSLFSLPCLSNLKEAAKTKETMKKQRKNFKTTSATRRGQTREITRGKTTKKQMPPPPPQKKGVRS